MAGRDTHFDPISLGPLSVQMRKVFFDKANAEIAVAHGLGVTPIGWILIGIDSHATIKDGATPLASNAIRLVSDTDGVGATILIVAVNYSKR